MEEIVEDGINYGPWKPLGGVVEIKKEPEMAVEQIIKRGGRRKASASLFENKYMLSTTEHRMRFGFSNFQYVIDEELESSDSDNSKSDDDKDDTEYLKNIPEKFHNSTTCCVCLQQLDITQDVAIHTGCKDSQGIILPHPLHYPSCFIESIAWPKTSINYGGLRTKKMPSCFICNKEGQWYLSRLSKKKTGWVRGRKLPNGTHALGMTNYVDKEYDIDSTYFIHCDKLWYSINAQNNFFGLNNIPPRFPQDMFLHNIPSIFDKYTTLTFEKFECCECDKMVLKMDEVVLTNCGPTCEYCICRKCFLNQITTKPTFLGKPRAAGFLECPRCDKVSRAIFRNSDKKFVSALVRNRKNEIL